VYKLRLATFSPPPFQTSCSYLPVQKGFGYPSNVFSSSKPKKNIRYLHVVFPPSQKRRQKYTCGLFPLLPPSKIKRLRFIYLVNFENTSPKRTTSNQSHNVQMSETEKKEAEMYAPGLELRNINSWIVRNNFALLYHHVDLANSNVKRGTVCVRFLCSKRNKAVYGWCFFCAPRILQKQAPGFVMSPTRKSARASCDMLDLSRC
jgi:hypothetical protein